jgi:hypothetical protein
MMRASLPRRKIIQLFDRFDGRLTVMAFDAEGKRISTYSGLNPYLALAETAAQLARGRQVRLLLGEHVDNVRISTATEHLSDLPEDAAWNPYWGEMS